MWFFQGMRGIADMFETFGLQAMLAMAVISVTVGRAFHACSFHVVALADMAGILSMSVGL